MQGARTQVHRRTQWAQHIARAAQQRSTQQEQYSKNSTAGSTPHHTTPHHTTPPHSTPHTATPQPQQPHHSHAYMFHAHAAGTQVGHAARSEDGTSCHAAAQSQHSPDTIPQPQPHHSHTATQPHNRHSHTTATPQPREREGRKGGRKGAADEKCHVRNRHRRPPHCTVHNHPVSHHHATRPPHAPAARHPPHHAQHAGGALTTQCR